MSRPSQEGPTLAVSTRRKSQHNHRNEGQTSRRPSASRRRDGSTERIAPRVRSGSKARITALQHCCPLHFNQRISARVAIRFVVAGRLLVARAGLTTLALHPYRGSLGAGVNMEEKLVALSQSGNIRPGTIRCAWCAIEDQDVSGPVTACALPST